MTIKDITNNSIFVSIATIKENSFSEAYGIYKHNFNFVSRFRNILFYYNIQEGSSKESVQKYLDMVGKVYPNAIIKVADVNYGHMFGTIDLEEKALEYIKKEFNTVDYIFKSMEDILISDSLSDLEIKKADFYYLPSFSYETTLNPDSDYTLPQTTFFILKNGLVDSLYGKDVYYKKTIYEQQKLKNPNLKAWEVDFEDGLKFDCENHLNRTVKNLNRESLLSKEYFSKLFNFVQIYRVGDPSHKNIYFSDLGLCHYHFPDLPVYPV